MKESMRRLALRVVALALPGLMLVTTNLHAEILSPDVLVRQTSEEVLRGVADDKELRNGNATRFIELIETKVVPHFDMQKMTRLAVSKSWRQASTEQQKQLVKEFQTLLVRSYGAAYSSFRYVKVDVKPLKISNGEDDVTVKSVILLPGGAPPVTVDYLMNLTADGWKVYNVVVEGVSLVTTYRNDFATQIEQTGIDGLIKNLQERNSKPATAQSTKK